MRKSVLLYGLLGGALIALLQAIEYRYLVVEHSVAIYGGLVAAVFAALGIWLGQRVTSRKQRVILREIPVPAPGPFVLNEETLAVTGLTRREREILEFIAAGLSNREIAERASVSENTVKTHSRRVFEKLGVRRRTQAVRRGKQLGLIP